jgi:hypothetical protein
MFDKRRTQSSHGIFGQEIGFGLVSLQLEQDEMQNERRFLIVVFNYGRIESLTANLKKIVDLDFDVDTLIVYDCSENSDGQCAVLVEYCRQYNLKFGEDVLFKPRVNWGLAEGARVDLAVELQGMPVQHRFLLQFQDHYLDTTSDHSVWPVGKIDLEGNDISGKVKGDCIKSGQTIELRKYGKLLETGAADVLYSSQEGIGLFPYWRENFFCIDGVNFATGIETYLNIFNEQTCLKLKKIYDETYKWALFAEHYIGYRMGRLGLNLYDTYYDKAFKNVLDLVEGLNSETCLTELMHVSERYYAALFHEYMDKIMCEEV